MTLVYIAWNVRAEISIISEKLKLGRFEIALFSYLGYFSTRSKSPRFQNKPFWRVLSLRTIKYLSKLKKLPRMRIWSFWEGFKLL